MIFALLAMIFTLSTILMNGMENDLKLYRTLESKKTFQEFVGYCIESSKNSVAVINAAHNSRLLTYCAYHFLPKDVSYAIGSYFSQSIATHYKHNLISYKSLNKTFKTEKIECKENRGKFLSRHDGIYSVVPNIGHEYALWDEANKNMREVFIFNHKRYITQLKSGTNKDNKSYTLSSLDTMDLTEKDKVFILCNRDDVYKKMVFDDPVSHYLFNNDCTRIAIGYMDKPKVHLVCTHSLDGPTLSLHGSIKVICAAHHSPLFVVGTNKGHLSSKLPNLVLIDKDNVFCLHGHGESVVSAEFNHTDTRLLTCSVNHELQFSHLILWDTTDVKNFVRIFEEQCSFQILKAFFISNGQQIVAMRKDGIFNFYDGLTGKSLNMGLSFWSNTINDLLRDDLPLCIWSDKNKQFLSELDSTLKIRTTKGQYIGKIAGDIMPVRMGLTVDQTTLVFMDKDNNAYCIKLYDQQDCKDIDFIQKHANLVDMYHLFSYSKKRRDHDKKDTGKRVKESVLSIQSYIHEQQKTEKK